MFGWTRSYWQLAKKPIVRADHDPAKCYRVSNLLENSVVNLRNLSRLRSVRRPALNLKSLIVPLLFSVRKPAASLPVTPLGLALRTEVFHPCAAGKARSLRRCIFSLHRVGRCSSPGTCAGLPCLPVRRNTQLLPSLIDRIRGGRARWCWPG